MFSSFSHSERSELFAQELDLKKQAVARVKEFRALLQPSEFYVVSSEVAGKLVLQPYKLGDKVERDKGVKVNSSVVEVEQSLINKSINRVQIKLDIIENKFASSKNRLTHLEKELERHLPLREKDVVSEQRLQGFKHDKEQASFLAQEIQLQQREIKNELDVQKLNLKKNNLMLNKYQIHLPEGWFVSEKHKHEGELIQPFQPILKLANHKKLDLEFYMSYDEIHSLKQNGLTAELTELDKKVALTLKGKSSEVDMKTKKVKVVFELDNASDLYEPGMNVLLKVNLKGDLAYYRIPKSYVSYQYGQAFVKSSLGQLYKLKVVQEELDSVLVLASTLHIDTIVLPEGN